MSRTFRVIRSVFLILSVLLCVAIPTVGFGATVFAYNGTCTAAYSFNQPCEWWQYTAIAMIYMAAFAIPALFVTLLIWVVMTFMQFFATRRKS